MNAVIIAAGMGTRLNPLTLKIPKPLVEVFGKPMLEKSIEYLIEKNINEIIIVVGYMKEKFEYLEKKYKEVKLIYNSKYKEYNNIYSFYLVKDYLKDTYFLDGDIFLKENIFQEDIKDSKYFSKKINTYNNEWQLILEDGKVKRVDIGGSGNYIMSGISFFTEKATEKLKNLVEDYVKDEEKLKKYYWDHIVKENIDSFDISIEKIKDDVIFEIDNLKELLDLDSSYESALEEYISNFNEAEKIKKILENKVKELSDGVKNIKFIGGMTNKNYLIEKSEKAYVLRVPGEGTEVLINRNHEEKNLRIVSKLKIDVELCYFDVQTGMKISEYIKNSKTITPEIAEENLKEVAMILKKLHTSKIKFSNIFDPFKEIIKYENLIKEEKGEFYSEYFEIRSKVFELKDILKKLQIELKPCHNDTVPENFLKNRDRFFLIDWEYSGMNDCIWDLAAFSIESNLTKEAEKKMLNYYFENDIDKNILLRMEIHKICQDFLWSIWTIFKEIKGVSFGEYGIRRFKNAKIRLEALKK